MRWTKALPFSNFADHAGSWGNTDKASLPVTPAPPRFARHVSSTFMRERKGDELAARASSPPSIGGEVASEARRSGGRKGEVRDGALKHVISCPGIRGFLAALTFLMYSSPADAASKHDPDWPCIQRKVPELSLGQIWNGPELPAEAKNWSKDKDIAALVPVLAARRVPLAEAQKEIRDFAAGLPAEQVEDRMTMLVQGLFDHMNAERAEVISGIGRYASKQLELADRLRKQASEVDALRAKPGADAGELAQLTDRLTWETRIFDERVQSLTYVCEVPTLIEQRLYALAKAIADVLAGR
jgi:hypothetical protein